MEYNRTRSSSMLSVVKSRVSDVKSVMLRNMDAVLERETETVSVLTEEADDPQATVSDLRVCWVPGSTVRVAALDTVCSRQRHTRLLWDKTQKERKGIAIKLLKSKVRPVSWLPGTCFQAWLLEFHLQNRTEGKTWVQQAILTPTLTALRHVCAHTHTHTYTCTHTK